MEAIISSLIVGVLALVGTIVSAKYVSNVRVVKLEMQMTQLDKKVYEHNRLIDRMYKVEERVALIENVTNNRGGK